MDTATHLLIGLGLGATANLSPLVAVNSARLLVSPASMVIQIGGSSFNFYKKV